MKTDAKYVNVINVLRSTIAPRNARMGTRKVIRGVLFVNANVSTITIM